MRYSMLRNISHKKRYKKQFIDDNVDVDTGTSSTSESSQSEPSQSESEVVCTTDTGE